MVLKMKIHYGIRPIKRYDSTMETACGGLGWTIHGHDIFPKYRPLDVTRIRKQVTCGKCKKTKLFRNVI